jgi:O-antigen/teichoic acid export membrane protein
VESIGDVFHGLAQKRERLDLVAVSIVLKALLGLSLFAVAFTHQRSLPGAMGALVAGWALAILCFDVPVARVLMRTVSHGLAATTGALRPLWRRSALKGVLLLTWPLAVIMLLAQLRHTVPRAVLEAHGGEQMLGVFSALAYLTVAGNTLATALTEASIARMSRLFAAGDRAGFRRGARRLWLTGILIGSAGVLLAVTVGRWLLEVVYTPEYATRADVLVWIIAAGGMNNLGSLLAGPVTAMRAFGPQLILHFGNVLLLGWLSFLFIPRFGLMGAAWAILGGGVWIAVGYTAVLLQRTGSAAWPAVAGSAEKEPR